MRSTIAPPFRGEQTSRCDWFTTRERGELLDLPEAPWRPVTWRVAKVNRDWHIQLDTVKYSVPHRFAGQSVDVRIMGEEIAVMTDGEIIATHRRGPHRNSYVTDGDHAPAHADATAGLWTRAYFMRQAGKIGPGTVDALTRLLDRRVIEAQGFRSCMNILELGRGENRPLLEAACRQLCDEDDLRPISYTAVKHRLTALRQNRAARPTTTGHAVGVTTAARPPGDRDTSRAHLAGVEQFRLDALTGTTGEETSR